MEDKVNILNLEMYAVNGGTETAIYVDKRFHEAATEELGSRYMEVEQELLNALESAVRRYSKQLDCLVKEKTKEVHSENENS